MRFLVTCCLLFLLAHPAHTAPAMWGLGNPAYHEVASETIGRSFNVWVSLPDGYDESDDTRYPTLYVLDGGGMFPLVATYGGYLQFGNEFPAAIIVGVGYPGVTFEEGNFRSTDYTAPSDEREWYGGAGNFQSFLADTLMPFTGSNIDGLNNVRFAKLFQQNSDLPAIWCRPVIKVYGAIRGVH